MMDDSNFLLLGLGGETEITVSCDQKVCLFIFLGFLFESFTLFYFKHPYTCIISMAAVALGKQQQKNC